MAISTYCSWAILEWPNHRCTFDYMITFPSQTRPKHTCHILTLFLSHTTHTTSFMSFITGPKFTHFPHILFVSQIILTPHPDELLQPYTFYHQTAYISQFKIIHNHAPVIILFPHSQSCDKWNRTGGDGRVPGGCGI